MNTEKLEDCATWLERWAAESSNFYYEEDYRLVYAKAIRAAIDRIKDLEDEVSAYVDGLFETR